jgi:adenylate kinase family enzyme
MASMGRRIVVKGASGSGKTVVAARLAGALRVPHVELDALYHGPNRAEPPLEEFHRRVDEATTGEGWVVDGNYDRNLGDLLLRRADVVVWLDLPLRVILPRLWQRTASRIRNDVELWNGNRDDWRNALWGRESLFLWAIRTHRRLRRELAAAARQSEAEVVRLRTPEEVERWLDAQTSTTTGRIIGLRRVRS